MTGHDLLRQHIESLDISFSAFARDIGRGGPLVWLWAHGKRAPNRQNAIHLEKVTGGAVRADVWVPISSSPASRKASPGSKRKRKGEKKGRNARAGTRQRSGSGRNRGVSR